MDVVAADRVIARSTIAARSRPDASPTLLRTLLALGILVGGGLAASLPAAAVDIDPDLVRLIRFMAVLKGAFLVAALWASAWRLGRPAQAWRAAVYIAAPAFMAFGTLALWRLQAAGLAATTLHLGLVAFIATSLTDRDFIPSRRPR